MRSLKEKYNLSRFQIISIGCSTTIIKRHQVWNINMGVKYFWVTVSLLWLDGRNPIIHLQNTKRT